MVYGQSTDPRTATLKDTTTVSGPGFLLTNDSTNNKLDLCAATEVPIGVSAADSSRDADVAGSNKKVGIYVGNGETPSAGDLVPVNTTTAADA